MLLHICYKFWNSRISPLWRCATTQMSRTGAERWMGMWWIPDLVFKETFHCILQHKPFVWKPWCRNPFRFQVFRQSCRFRDLSSLDALDRSLCYPASTMLYLRILVLSHRCLRSVGWKWLKAIVRSRRQLCGLTRVWIIQRQNLTTILMQHVRSRRQLGGLTRVVWIIQRQNLTTILMQHELIIMYVTEQAKKGSAYQPKNGIRWNVATNRTVSRHFTDWMTSRMCTRSTCEFYGIPKRAAEKHFKVVHLLWSWFRNSFMGRWAWKSPSCI